MIKLIKDALNKNNIDVADDILNVKYAFSGNGTSVYWVLMKDEQCDFRTHYITTVYLVESTGIAEFAPEENYRGTLRDMKRKFNIL